MKRVYVLSLLVILALVVTPLPALAQDDAEFEEFESEDGLLTLSYPAGWLTEEDNEFFPAFLAGTTEHAIEQMNEEITKPESGELLMFVLILPTDFMTMMMELDPADTPIIDLTTMLGTAFLTPDEPEDGYALEFEEAEEVELDGDVVIGQIGFTDNYAQGIVMLRQLSDDLFVISLTGTAAGEMTDELAALGQHTVASVAYAGSGADLVAGMVAPPDIEEAPEGVTAADLDGEALVAERCTVCHSADRITRADKDEAGWTDTVDRMIGYGADLNTAEREAVITYLSSK